MNACLHQEAANGSDSASVCFSLRVRPMKYGANSIERDPHTRASTFADFGTQVNEHLFDVRPEDIGLAIINRLNDPPMLIHPFLMIPIFDTNTLPAAEEL